MSILQFNEGELDAPLFYSQGTWNQDKAPNSQDLGSYLTYQQKCLNRKEEAAVLDDRKDANQKIKSHAVKRKNASGTRINFNSASLTSHVIKKVKKGHRLIKISITNLEETSSDEDEEVMCQYVVHNSFDEILEIAENLIGKIGKKFAIE